MVPESEATAKMVLKEISPNKGFMATKLHTACPRLLPAPRAERIRQLPTPLLPPELHRPPVFLRACQAISLTPTPLYSTEPIKLPPSTNFMLWVDTNNKELVIIMDIPDMRNNLVVPFKVVSDTLKLWDKARVTVALITMTKVTKALRTIPLLVVTKTRVGAVDTVVETHTLITNIKTNTTLNNTADTVDRPTEWATTDMPREA
jgi:hypothetical protein